MNVKKKLSISITAVSLLAAIVCGVQFIAGGAEVFKGGMVLALVFAALGFVGVWVSGLSQRTDPDSEAWMTAIK